MSQSETLTTPGTGHVVAEEARPRGRAWRRWAKRVCVAAVCLFLVYHSWFLVRVFRLRGANPETTAFMEQRAREAAGRNVPAKREQVWVPYEQISPHLVRAVIAGEDPTFRQHSGINWRATFIAARMNLRARRIVNGASTINQQLAKNLFFSSSKSFLRKLHEGLIAYELEYIVGEQRILELYLNLIEWGDGTYGAEAASRRYFNSPAASLNEEQAAFLAAIIPDPRRGLNPDLRPDYVNYRRDVILASMSDEQVSQATLRGLAVTTVTPEFPAEAKAAGAAGVVISRVTVGESGDVSEVKLLASPHPLIGEAVAQALGRWKFKPPRADGHPAPVTGRVTFFYSIENGEGRVRNPLF